MEVVSRLKHRGVEVVTMAPIKPTEKPVDPALPEEGDDEEK